MKVKISSSGIQKVSSTSTSSSSTSHSSSTNHTKPTKKTPIGSVITISSEIANDPGLTPSHRIPNKPSQVKIPFSTVGSVTTITKPTNHHTHSKSRDKDKGKDRDRDKDKEKGKEKKHHSSSSSTSGKHNKEKDKEKNKGKEKEKSKEKSKSKSKHSTGDKEKSSKKPESSTSESKSSKSSSHSHKSSSSSNHGSSTHDKKSSNSTAKSSSSGTSTSSTKPLINSSSSSHTKSHSSTPKTSNSNASTSTSTKHKSSSSSKDSKEKDKKPRKSSHNSADDKKGTKESGKTTNKRKHPSTTDPEITIINAKIPKLSTKADGSGKPAEVRADGLPKSSDSSNNASKSSKVDGNQSSLQPQSTTKKKSEKSKKSTIAHGSKKSNATDGSHNSIDAANVLKQNNTTIESEMKHLLQAFGDVPHSYPATVEMLAKILKAELGGFLYICETMAQLASSKILGLQEAVAALRRDANRLVRIYDYFAHQEIALKNKALLQNEALKSTITTDMLSVLRRLNIIDVLTRVGGRLEELEDYGSSFLDEDFPASSSQSSKFLEYSLIRNVSLSRKMSVKQLIISQVAHHHYELKVTKTFMEILQFLVLDLACFLVNSAFSIQQSQESQVTKRFLDTRGINEDTCMSAPFFQKKRKDDNDCNQITEILVQASEMEANRLKKANITRIKTNQQIPNKPNENSTYISRINALLPESLSEAYIRYQDSFTYPSPSFKVQAMRKQKYIGY